MSVFDTTAQTSTGEEFTEEEKQGFRDEWGLISKNNTEDVGGIKNFVDGIKEGGISLSNKYLGINASVGGRNLLEGTDFIHNTGDWVFPVNYPQTENGITYVRQGYAWDFKSHNLNIDGRNSLTLSALLRSSTDTRARIAIYYKDINNTLQDITIYINDITTDWKRFSKTFTVDGVIDTIQFLTNGELMDFAQIKLENGTFATDWTLTLEDLNEIYALKAGSITQDFSADTMTANQYLPFTGCHLAEFNNQDFKEFELVKIKSTGFSSNKQPIWEASYPRLGDKGVFGVVYGMNIQPIMEEYQEDELQKVSKIKTKIIESTEIKEVNGEYIQIKKEKEIEEPVMIEHPVLNEDKTPVMQTIYKTENIMDGKQIVGSRQVPTEIPLTHAIQATEEKLVTVTKQRQIGEIKHWMIACIGDMPMFVCCENGNIKYGDKLTPSSQNGIAMKANSDSSICGIAGCDVNFDGDEIIKIGVTKE